MKILVTGAAGFIGSHVAEKLAGLGHEVLGVDCFTDYYAVALKEINARDVMAAGARFLRLDLATDSLQPAVEGVEVVFHLAAQPGLSAHTSFDTYVRNNILATHKLLKAAKDLSTLKCFVYISTSSVYGAHATDAEDAPPKPTSYYGVTKLAAEQLVLARHRREGLPACSLRLFSVYGPRERPEKLYHKLIKSILEDLEFPLFEGSEEHTRSYTHVDDVLAGMISVLNNLDACTGQIFNLGSDREITTGRGIRIVEDILGKKARKVIQPRRPGDQRRTHADIAKARRILGYVPRVSPEDGLRSEVDWYKDRVLGQIAP